MSREPNSDARAFWAWVAVVTLVGLFLRVDARLAPFAEDDFTQRAMLDGVYAVPRAWWDLYRFWESSEFALHRAAGTLPWWSSPELDAGVFRPLSSALLALDHAVFPDDSAAHHVHSLAWWVSAVVAAGFALRRMLPASLAWIAVAVFALDDSTVSQVGWLANRCTLVSATFGFWSLGAFVRWRDRGRRRDAFTSAATGCLALTGGEYALALVPYALAHEWCRARSSPGASTTAFDRARGMWPILGPAVAYLIVHVALGYGSSGSVVYASPLDDPLDYVRTAIDRIPLLVTNAGFGMSSGVDEMLARPTFDLLGLDALAGAGWMFWLPDTPTVQDVVSGHRLAGLLGSLALVAAIAIARPFWDSAERRALLGLATGALASTLLVAVAPPHPRLLVFTELGASALVAGVLVAGARAWSSSRPPWRRALAGTLGVLFAYAHLLVDPVWTRQHIAKLTEHHDRLERGFEGLADDLGGRDVVLVAAEDQTTGIRAAGVLESRGHAPPRSWQTLSMAQLPHTLQRLDERTVLVSPVGGPLLARDVERFFRATDVALQIGDETNAGGMHVLVTRIGDDGHPDQLRVTFAEPLEHYVWMIVDDGLRVIDTPAIGAITLAPFPRPPG